MLPGDPQDSTSVQLHQKFYGMADIPPGYTLWLMGHRKSETSVFLLGPVHVEKRSGAESGPATWNACPQIGDFPSQKGSQFEITAAFVPEAQSAYLLGATTYTGIQLTPAKAGAPVAGLVSTQFPPGTDPRHQASVWVTLTGGGENCSTR